MAKKKVSSPKPSVSLYEDNTTTVGATSLKINLTPEKPINKYPGAVQCLRCKKVLVSFHRHDYKVCGCPNRTMVDGGHDYLRCGGADLKFVQVLRFTTARKRKK